MADPLLDYMVKVNEDPDLMARHNEDPEKAAREFGLSNEDVLLIKGGDPAKLKERCSLKAPDPLLITFHTPV